MVGALKCTTALVVVGGWWLVVGGIVVGGTVVGGGWWWLCRGWFVLTRCSVLCAGRSMPQWVSFFVGRNGQRWFFKRVCERKLVRR